MVIKNDLDPTLGSLMTRLIASAIRLVTGAFSYAGRYDIKVESNGVLFGLIDWASRFILGGLPNKVDMAISIGRSPKSLSVTTNLSSEVAAPTML
jgi:hypothetical protein